MLQNFITTFFRNFWRNKKHYFLNIFGLALGMACGILILLWITDEKSIDSFHSSKAYTVYEKTIHDGKIDAGYGNPALLADELKKTFPEIKYAVSLDNPASLHTFEANDKIIKEKGIYAEKDFFNVLDYKIIKGYPANALNSVSSIAISEQMAERFFGNAEEAIGKTLRYENSQDFTITAVFDNAKKKSSEEFNYIINWQTFLNENGWAQSMNNTGPNTDILLSENVDANSFEKKITHFLDQYNTNNHGYTVELALQKLNDKYLHSNFKNGIVTGGRIEYIKIFGIIAMMILLIACINFMNLSTAFSFKRSKEIGVRKTIGARRSMLIAQFIGEAMLLAVMSLILAILVIALLLPAFNALLNKEIQIPFSDSNFWGLSFAVALSTGFFAGIYPAFFLSSFDPAKVLKGSPKFDFKAVLLRKGLVVFQFFLCIAFITSTIIIKKQLQFLQTKELGYDRENLVYIPLEGSLQTNYKTFKEETSAIPFVKNISLISQPPTAMLSGTYNVNWQGKTPDFKPRFLRISVGYDFVKTMNITLMEGRDFSKDFLSDSASVIINEEALKTINLKNPIGQTLSINNQTVSVVGVVKDFHSNSLHTPIQPLIMLLNKNENYGTALIRIQGDKTKQALSSLESTVKELNPGFPFTYQFADEEYAKLYRTDQLVNKLATDFTFLAIVISCLGLFGLSIFTAEQRIKEIAVRKVLGAKISSIVLLLSKDFLILVAIAGVLAFPVAWYNMNNWLKDFAYRISINWWIFFLAGAMAVLLAFITVSFQAIKTAITNPVKSLRTE